jgi:DNA-binding transcriptional regulator YdaS (Cro superfamily)
MEVERRKESKDHVLTIAGITKGEVKPYQIRPDLPELSTPPQEA